MASAQASSEAKADHGFPRRSTDPGKEARADGAHLYQWRDAGGKEERTRHHCSREYMLKVLV